MAGDPELLNAEIVLLLCAGVLTLGSVSVPPWATRAEIKVQGRGGGRRARLACGGCLALLNTCVRFNGWHALKPVPCAPICFPCLACPVPCRAVCAALGIVGLAMARAARAGVFSGVCGRALYLSCFLPVSCFVFFPDCKARPYRINRHGIHN